MKHQGDSIGIITGILIVFDYYGIIRKNLSEMVIFCKMVPGPGFEWNVVLLRTYPGIYNYVGFRKFSYLNV